MWNIFWTINKFLYKLLGPNLSTNLSQTGFGKFVLRTLKGKPGRMQIYSGKDGIRLKLAPHEAEYFGFFHFGSMNLYETAAITRALHSGDSFIDVGAYVDGWHSIVAGRIVGDTGHVYAFEPIPDFYLRAKENFALNNLSNVTLEQMAVSKRDGNSIFYNNSASSSFYAKHARHGKTVKLKKIRVRTTKLDSYIKKHNIKNIRLIKIDAEGAEMDVLAGMPGLLRRDDAPDLIIEVDDRYLRDGGTSESEILECLRRYGYTPYSILVNGLGRYKRKDEGRELFNAYFSKRHHL